MAAEKIWVCNVCGYVHRGEQPPAVCPDCDATAEAFELQIPAPAPAATPPSLDANSDTSPNHPNVGTPPIIIVGAGIAGVSAAEAARRQDPDVPILLVSGEAGLPYYRVNLTRYLAGEVGASELDLHPASWYAERRIEILPGALLRDIDPVRKEVRLLDGETLAWRSLVLATGSHSFVPPVPGMKREGVTVLRKRADADLILATCQKPVRCAIIGGGLLGLETAGALARRGAEVTVLDNAPWLLSRQLTRRAAEILEQRVLALGIRVRKECRVRELEGDERVREVRFEDGSSLPAELVVLSAGVRPNLYAAKMAGLAVKNGVVVDDSLRTSAPDIYAAGDLCEHAGMLYGLWSPAQLQGAAAGTNAAGGRALFRGIPRSASIKVLGIGMMSAGDVHSPGLEIREDESEANYSLLAFRDGKLAGAILLGDTSRAAAVKKALEAGVDLTASVIT